MHKNVNRYPVSLSFVVFVVFVIGCAKLPSVELSKPDDGIYNPYGVAIDPVNQVQSATISKEAKGLATNTYKIPAKNIYVDRKREKKEDDGGKTLRISKISPVLQEWLSTKMADEPVKIIVTFQEDLQIPRLPELGEKESRESGKNRRSEAIKKLKRAREKSQAMSLKRLAEYGDFKQSDSFWIVNSVVGTVKIGGGLVSHHKIFV